LHQVPALLHLPHHPQVDRVPEVQERRGDVGAELDPQLPARVEQAPEFREADDVVRRPRERLD